MWVRDQRRISQPRRDSYTPRNPQPPNDISNFLLGVEASLQTLLAVMISLSLCVWCLFLYSTTLLLLLHTHTKHAEFVEVC